jgi:hypothetical protein
MNTIINSSSVAGYFLKSFQVEVASVKRKLPLGKFDLHDQLLSLIFKRERTARKQR